MVSTSRKVPSSSGTVHFIPDRDDPARIVATLAQQLPPGSYMAISHLTGDFAPASVAAPPDLADPRRQRPWHFRFGSPP
ncbi:MAG TPA: SAM-dependent methyltransferase [Streptosporangiaceae bacterium]|nr:SAM-dependent methyltransferase [Streptosporangiaceae bacterium]